MRSLPKSIHRCHRYPTKFNSGRDFPLDEVVVREYIRNQEKEDRRLEQLNLDWSSKEPD